MPGVEDTPTWESLPSKSVWVHQGQTLGGGGGGVDSLYGQSVKGVDGGGGHGHGHGGDGGGGGAGGSFPSFHGRCLHSSTFRLNVSAFVWNRGCV